MKRKNLTAYVTPILIFIFVFSILNSRLEASTVEMKIERAQIEYTKPNGYKWDIGGSSMSKPDPFVVIKVNGRIQFETEIKKDTHSPEWNQTFSINFESGDKRQLQKKGRWK